MVRKINSKLLLKNVPSKYIVNESTDINVIILKLPKHFYVYNYVVNEIWPIERPNHMEFLNILTLFHSPTRESF